MLLQTDKLEDLDLTSLPDNLYQLLMDFNNKNELLYDAIKNNCKSEIQEFLKQGYPYCFEDFLAQLDTSDQEIFKKTKLNSKVSGLRPNLKTAFDFHYDFLEIYFFSRETKRLNVDTDTLDMMAPYFFEKNIETFKNIYFCYTKNVSLTYKLVKKILTENEEYRSCLNALMYNKNSVFIDILIDCCKNIDIKKRNKILYPPDSLNYYTKGFNEKSYKKVFDENIDKVINEQLLKIQGYNVQNYEKINAINDVFSSFCHIKLPVSTEQHILSTYSKMTGVAQDFVYLAISYGLLENTQFYFEIEWHEMSKDFKDKYTMLHFIEKNKPIRYKNLLQSKEIAFLSMFKGFSKKQDNRTFQEFLKIKINTKYYPELYEKYQLDKNTEEAKNISRLNKL